MTKRQNNIFISKYDSGFSIYNLQLINFCDLSKPTLKFIGFTILTDSTDIKNIVKAYLSSLGKSTFEIYVQYYWQGVSIPKK